MTNTDLEFSVQQAVEVQAALRGALGLGPETFPLPAFVGMISDEIEQMRAAGRTDTEVADIIEAATGKRLDIATLALFYAPPEARRRAS